MGLISARKSLALAIGDNNPVIEQIDSLLGMEIGGEDDSFTALSAAAKDPEKSINKQALKLVRDKAEEENGVDYLNPGDGPLSLDGVEDITAYVLGPPRRESLLVDENPEGNETFPSEDHAHGFSFLSAAGGSGGAQSEIPFSRKYAIPASTALRSKFFRDQYGTEKSAKDLFR